MVLSFWWLSWHR